ncbi:Putative lumenal protein, contains 8 pentapeptide repeats, sll0577 homolog [uncultured Gammaproteobacteria bacterium]|nr:Putative lumenal protein, contains 8 pentapeptide repeats, sll0577 homolog [uncultured Gammaproteobacteria bacterium]
MRKISPEALKKILAKHQLWLDSIQEEGERANLQKADLRGADLQKADLQWADLRGADLQWANLQKADLRGADLRGADLRGADLRGASLRGAQNLIYALNAQEAYLDEEGKQLFDLNSEINELENLKQELNQAKQASKDKERLEEELDLLKNTQNKNQQEKTDLEKKLTQEINEKTRQAEQAVSLREKLDEITKERDHAQDEELKLAIKRISDTTISNNETLEKYQKQSQYLMYLSVILFVLAIIVAFTIYYLNIDNILKSESFNHIALFSPSFILALTGTAFLRHDWKIRQLSQQLNTQKNKIAVATGVLESSLNLIRIDDIEKEGFRILKESFVDMRQALLFDKKKNNSNNIKDEGGLTIAIKELQQHLKLLKK